MPRKKKPVVKLDFERNADGKIKSFRKVPTGITPPKPQRIIQPKAPFMVNMDLVRRIRLGNLAQRLDTTLVALVEMGVDMVFEKLDGPLKK